MLINIHPKIVATKLFFLISGVIGIYYFTAIIRLGKNYTYMFEPLLCWLSLFSTFIFLRINSDKLKKTKEVYRRYIIQFKTSSILIFLYQIIRVITFLLVIPAILFIVRNGLAEARFLYFSNPDKIYFIPYVRDFVECIILPISIISESVLIWDSNKPSIYRGRFIHFFFLSLINFGRFYLYWALFFSLIRYLLIKNMKIIPKINFYFLLNQSAKNILKLIKRPFQIIPILGIISYIFLKLYSTLVNTEITSFAKELLIYFEKLIVNYHIIGFGIFFQISEYSYRKINELSSCTLIGSTYHYFQVFLAKLGIYLPICQDILSSSLSTRTRLEALNSSYNAFGTNLIRWFFSYGHIGTIIFGILLGIICSLIFYKAIYAPITAIGFFLIYFGIFDYSFGSPYIIFSIIFLILFPNKFLKTYYIKKD